MKIILLLCCLLAKFAHADGENDSFILKKSEYQSGQLCLVFSHPIKSGQNKLVHITPAPISKLVYTKNKLCVTVKPKTTYHVHLAREFASTKDIPLHYDPIVILPLDLNPFSAVSFRHHDWELRCDNTRTCRAAGYPDEKLVDDDIASILLTREAGENAKPSASINLFSSDESILCLEKAIFRINGQDYGQIALEDCAGDLSTMQTHQLLSTLKGNSKIEFIVKNISFSVSDKGATAVLIKMDEFQGRVGKPSALIKKGNDASPVLPSVTQPVIQAMSALATPVQEITINKDSHPSLIQSLSDLPCEEEKLNPLEARIYSLNNDEKLLKTRCWIGAYNSANYFVIVDKELTTTLDFIGYGEGFNPETGEIFGDWKGRGFGDCWTGVTYIWDGKRFTLSERFDTGMCRGFIGGAWHLPRFVSEVIPPKNNLKSK